MMSRPRNTKKGGLVEFLVYKEGKTFVGVCLTFDIIEEGKDPHKLMQSVREAALGHLRTVRDLGLSDELLNRHAPKEYWQKYEALQSARKLTPSPYEFSAMTYPQFLATINA